MHRFIIFVDGSNLAGVLRRLNLRVDSYEPLFRHVFEGAARAWRTTFDGGAAPAQLHRVKWYEVGSFDEWNLDDAKAQAVLRDIFERDKDLKRAYHAIASQTLTAHTPTDLTGEAWSLCFKDLRRWYDERRDLVEGFRRFHYAIRSSTDFIDVIECGHWRLDLLHRQVVEKGLDTRLAVDTVTLLETYDVAVLISSDTDSIPSLEHVQAKGRHVGVVDFLPGHPRERKAAQPLSRLKVAADFVLPVYEMDLVNRGIAKKGTAAAASASARTSATA